MIDTKQIGNVTELEVLTYITKLGYQVSIPFGDRERYDQIWDVNGKLLKIQIKTSHYIDEEKTAIKFSCKSTSRKNGKCVASRYTKREIDYFATICEGQCYVVPVEECSVEKILRFVPPKNGQTIGITFAESYKAEEVLKSV